MAHKMKTALVIFILFAVLKASTSMAIILPMTFQGQQQNNWCWASCIQGLANYFDHTWMSQCIIANTQNCESGYCGMDNCCNYPSFYYLFNSPPLGGGYYICDKPAPFLGTVGDGQGSVMEVLKSGFGIPSNGYDAYLTQGSVDSELYAGRPFIMDWNEGGTVGHALVAYGSDGSTYRWWDPTYGLMTGTYSGMVADYGHIWAQTILPVVTVQPPLPDIKVNGMDGNITVSGNSWVDVTISLNAGGFSGTSGDQWVLAYYDGYWFIYDSSGNWNSLTTSNAIPMRQGAIANTGAESVLSGPFPPGTTMTFYYGVDLTEDGVYDNPVYVDSVTVTSN